LRLVQDGFAARVVSAAGGFAHSCLVAPVEKRATPSRKDTLMNPLYTFTEESRLTAAAMAEARHLRALAPAAFWSAARRWAGRLAHGLAHRAREDAAARPQAK
jgi:hypothetical protein